MRVFVVLSVCAWLCVAVNCSLAPFITPCHASDSACLKSSAQKAVKILAAGIPSLGLQTLDPMHVDRIQATQNGLIMDFKNTDVKGLRNCVVLDLVRRKGETALNLKCSVTLIGDYKLGGHLMVFPITGEGKYKIKIHDIVVKVVFKVGERVINGEKYWTVPSFTHSAEVLTQVHFQFQNLFGGKKDLSDSIHEFANSNWKDIFHDMSPPIVKAIVSGIVSETNKFFEKVPIKDLALD